jgi:hypothetical protein
MRFTELSNEEVLSSLKALLAEGNRILVKVLAYLAEVEDRRIHLELACSSMFNFLVRRLGFSEGEAFRRLTASRLVRRFPKLLDAIASGRLHLSAVVLLRDLFSEENVDALIEAASRKSKREVEALVARLAPKPDVADSIRKLPDASPVGATPGAPTRSDAPRHVPAPAPQLQPLSESRYRIQLTASATLRDKLEHARALMSHQNPSGDLAIVVEKALDLLVEKLEKTQLGKTERPRAARAPAKPAYVTRAARREVARRDGASCSFVSKDGERCSSREFLELDHRVPRALGGTGDATNLRWLCRAHNRHAAEQVFGREHVEERIDFSQRECGTAAATRELVRRALRNLGFRSADTDRAMSTLAQRGGWDRPVESLVRDALGILT